MKAFASVPDDRHWALQAAIVLMLGVFWTFLSRAPSAAALGAGAPPSARAGFSAPDFSLNLLGGGQVTLSALRGKVVIVNLWASWCPPCRAEMPAIEKIYQAYKGQGLEVLAINATFQDSEPDAATFVQHFGLTFPIPLDRTGGVSNRYLLRALPSTYFIDRRGIVQFVAIGAMNEALIQSKVEELVQETP